MGGGAARGRGARVVDPLLDEVGGLVVAHAFVAEQGGVTQAVILDSAGIEITDALQPVASGVVGVVVSRGTKGFDVDVAGALVAQAHVAPMAVGGGQAVDSVVGEADAVAAVIGVGN